MKSEYPQRKSPRLQGYDYSQCGAYFVTICTAGKIHYFGTIISDSLQISLLGQIAHNELARIPERWQQFDVDLFVIMPDHIHLIILLFDHNDGKNHKPTLGNIVGSYKAGVTRSARQEGLIAIDEFLWQERFHDHIIRTEISLNSIRQYVATNPARWAEDKFYS